MSEPTYQQAKVLYDKLKVAHAELEQQYQGLRATVGQDHVNHFLLANDGLQLVVQAAEKGDPGARQQLDFLVRSLDRARAVLAGIALPSTTAAVPKSGLSIVQ